MRALYKFLAPMCCSPHLRRWERFVPVTGQCCTRGSIRCRPQPLMPDLFATAGAAEPWDEMIARGSVLLRGFALLFVDNILVVLGDITAQAPFRHMTTPWGAAMSVAMTNCGEAGWLLTALATAMIGSTPKPASR